MKNILILCASVMAFQLGVSAHEPFKLVSSEKKTIKFEELLKVEKDRTIGKKEGTTLTFAENEVRLVVRTGPEDDMLS